MVAPNEPKLPYPVYFNTRGQELPTEGTFYVVAKDGFYLHKDTGLVKATVKVDRISFLEPLVTKVRLNLPILPARIAVRALLFFRRVYTLYQSEAALLLHYSESEQKYKLTCPTQQVGKAMVHYGADERIEGYKLVGSLHSHCDFGAFHSGIDIKDEASFDGLHITIGQVDQAYFTLVASAVVNNNRFPLDLERMISGLMKVDYEPRPKPTHRRTVTRGYAVDALYPHPLNLTDVLLDYEPYPNLQKDKTEYWDLVLPEGQDYRSVSFPTSWLAKVEPMPGLLSSLMELGKEFLSPKKKGDAK